MANNNDQILQNIREDLFTAGESVKLFNSNPIDRPPLSDTDSHALLGRVFESSMRKHMGLY